MILLNDLLDKYLDVGRTYPKKQKCLGYPIQFLVNP